MFSAYLFDQLDKRWRSLAHKFFAHNEYWQSWFCEKQKKYVRFLSSSLVKILRFIQTNM